MATGVTSSISRFGLSEPFELQVARGQITGHSLVNIFGYQENVATTFVPVWENVAAIPYPGSAVAMSAVSDSASDTAVVIQIQGLDTNHNLLIANLTMNGLTPVTTTALFLHVNNVITTSGNAVGNITISNGGTTYAKINAGIGKSQMSIYSVPAGQPVLMRSASKTAARTTTVCTAHSKLTPMELFSRYSKRRSAAQRRILLCE